jgi:RHH-type rel operon transcriptional repressor/antitoxin RelB
MYSVLVVREEKVMLAIRLPADIEKRLDDLAKKTGRTKTFYARQAILEHLEDLEDMYLAQAVIERIDAGQEQVFSLDEVEKELGLAH